jgi:AAA ATPase domain/AAA domain, putative AbiEii toxin, Type IV TA system
MRISEVEIRNYAGFSRQHIPLKPGVALLVGKNNAGKSALLRILKFQNDESWRNYVASDSPASMTVRFSPSAEDELLTRRDRDNRPILVPGEEVRVQVSLSAEGERRLVSAELLTTDGQELPLIGTNPSNGLVQQYWYGPSGTGASSNRGIQSFDFKRLQIPDDLSNAVWIRANRAIGQQVPAAANREIPTDGRLLATFLQTLQGEREDLYSSIEQKFCTCFPEFAKVNVAFQANTQHVIVTLRERAGRRVHLQHCGAGVEQALIMLSCVFGVDRQTLFLIDEPHNFLHPSLERILVDLFSDSGHSFLLATHSAQMINSVPADKIVTIAKPGTPSEQAAAQSQDKGELLSKLGYRNSDLLFHDALIFVEGPSDPTIFAALFAKAECHSPKQLDVGYVELGGTGEFARFEDIQRLVIVQEKLLKSFSKTNTPHVYLFDGDKAQHREQLERTKPAGTQIRPIFLPLYEVENYLLDACAIATAINYTLKSLDFEEAASEQLIQARLDEALKPEELNEESAQLYYPQGWKNREPRRAVKGSRVLSSIYNDYKLYYDKRIGGAEIVAHVQLSEDAKNEITKLFSEFNFA